MIALRDNAALMPTPEAATFLLNSVSPVRMPVNCGEWESTKYP